MENMTTARPVYVIKFPLVKVRTGSRTGPRFRRVPDKTGLHGARACAAGMVTKALNHRDWQPYAGVRDAEARRPMERANMRLAALWARVFAGQIDQHDPRINATQVRVSAMVAAYCQSTAA